MSAPPYRTILHGTCLLNGQHPPGSALARECPRNAEAAAKRSARSRKAALTRWRGRQASPPPESGSDA